MAPLPEPFSGREQPLRSQPGTPYGGMRENGQAYMGLRNCDPFSIEVERQGFEPQAPRGNPRAVLLSLVAEGPAAAVRTD